MFQLKEIRVLFILVTLLALFKVFLKVAAAEDVVYLKPVNAVASSFDTTADWAPLPDAMSACDGDLFTRWSSAYKDGESIFFDIGSPKTFNKIIIRWEAAFSSDYDILTSNDGQRWNTILSQVGQDGGIDEFQFEAVKARYVKILNVKRKNPEWGSSIWEFEIYGPASANPGDLPLEKVYPERSEAKKDVKKIEEVVPSPGPITLNEFQKGVVYTSWKTGELSSKSSDLTLIHLYDIGVREISIMISYYQDDVDSQIIYGSIGEDTVSNDDLAHCINMAHALGMKAMLKPHVDPRSGEWRGDIIPSEEWFKSYKDYILRYAKLAESYNVEMYCIGTELPNASMKRWDSQWRDLARKVKEVYSGKITYCANWDEYKGVSFWDAMDFVGIDAYFPLTDSKNPSRDELIAAWERYAQQIDEWRKEQNITQPLIFGEIGYSSADGTNKYPWKVLSGLGGENEDQMEQAECFDAMLTVMTKRPYFKGIYLWNYFPKEVYSPLGFTLRGKIAENTIKKWFKKLK